MLVFWSKSNQGTIFSFCAGLSKNLLFCRLEHLEPKPINRHANHFLNILFSMDFWGHARIGKPVFIFVLFYYIILFIFFFGLEYCPEDEFEDGQWSPDYVKCNDAYLTQQLIKREIKQVASAHKLYTKVITFVLGFFVATMMRRWWSQVSNLPDIIPVAMALNASVKTEEVQRAKKLKHDILRYCLLSYSLLMIEITRENTTPKVRISKFYKWTTDIWKNIANIFRSGNESNEEKFNKSLCLKDITKGLLPAHEKSFFEGKEKYMAKYWGIPLNWACKKIQDNHDIMNHSYEVIDALTKHEHNLQSILEYHMNPFPNICSQAVHLAVWLYLLMSTYASQFCNGGKHHWMWLIFGVSLKKSFRRNKYYIFILSGHANHSNCCGGCHVCSATNG